MLLAILAVVFGVALLLWSADRFVEGSAATARHASLPPLLIGMVVVGFGTSAPEMFVSALSASQGNPGLALGNAYGSNIGNIAFILGVTSLISPIAVHSRVLRTELPILSIVTAFAVLLIYDLELTRIDSILLLAAFSGIMGWTIRQGLKRPEDALAGEMEKELEEHAMPLPRALFRLAVGLVLLIVSSRVLVWGAVEIAEGFGVSDLVIGLTVVALGTSLPELASSVLATRKGEHDIALGNVLGSNLFNTLAVVGIAGAIQPMEVSSVVLTRDSLVMGGLTVSLFVIGFGFRGQGRINRYEGAALLAAYLGYMGWLVRGALGEG